MGLLDNLGTLLKQELSQMGQTQMRQNTPQGGQSFGGSGNPATDILGQVLNGLSGKAGNVIAPTVLGGLAGALLGNKAGSGALGGALLMGGMQLWNQYKQRLEEESAKAQSGPSFTAKPAPANERAQRIIRAMVYAAKSDGHIDAQEQKAINGELAKLGLDSSAAAFIQTVMDEPLDPSTIANGITSADEALEIFAISCVALNVDNFMERAYMDALAAALNIPEDVKVDLIEKIHTPA